MAAAITPSDLFSLTNASHQDVGVTRQAAKRLERLTELVTTRWHELDESSHSTLLAFAYGAIAAPANLRDKGFAAVGQTWQAVSAVAGGETQRAFQAVMIQTFKLVSAVLDQVEHEHPEYVERMQTALDEALAGQSETLPTTREGKLAYLQRLAH